ncbi:MAG TPA: 23S rRNA (uracil(1939)-C(5))-methyltransferase RlmD [Candidatus Magasanikbacteria bacterium]|nr:MAG: hypothetical protein UY62_C0001G0039 [Parcubacteria group bacterium GW2011_GWF2_50_9]OGH90628.1 MAG: 23S rRNA (uracil-5-)-methyltransferase RumA [Candidatus Magasanikbacteria bacterium RIFOXYC2_FULL_39_8]HAT03590.1 23S rRNA (uracil(1939)-C(5))-methyltransferase RlmD [Candidatus Magasanikbacteria bacterium]
MGDAVGLPGSFFVQRMFFCYDIPTMSPIVTIEKLVFGGQGFARLNGKAIFVWNALPDEEVEIEYIKNKKDYAEAIATKIIRSSPERREPKDAHFLSTSPWQIVSYDKENQWKKEIAMETYKKIGGNIFENINPDIIFPTEEYRYRNKMEFSFFQKEDSTFSLAFFNRGGKQKFPIQKSELAQDCINTTAQKILNWVNKQNLERKNLKTLIVRSDTEGKTIAALFIKDELNFKDYPVLDDTLIGFQLYYSTHKSPASVPTRLLYSIGQDYLIETLHNTKLKLGLLSFFQVHAPIFEHALADISEHTDNNTDLIDFYSGVGSIGLPLAKKHTHITLVDNNDEAIHYANENIKLNNLKNCEAYCVPAEKITDIITSNKTIILDPPRAGLHEDVIKKLLEATPPKIIYLSCNLSTQARDIQMLSSKYHITFSRLYNFFPRTPHIEGLVVLSCNV